MQQHIWRVSLGATELSVRCRCPEVAWLKNRCVHVCVFYSSQGGDHPFRYNNTTSGRWLPVLYCHHHHTDEAERLSTTVHQKQLPGWEPCETNAVAEEILHQTPRWRGQELEFEWQRQGHQDESIHQSKEAKVQKFHCGKYWQCNGLILFRTI